MTTTARLGALANRAPQFVAVVYALVCTLALWRVLATIFLRVPFDPNEGWNAYLAQAAIAGHALYPAGDFVNNYPPLSFYVVGALGWMSGDAIIAGRVVSLLSFLAVAYAIARAARLMECGLLESGLGALYFAAVLLVGSDYVGMNDPQLLGHALQMAALVLLLKSTRNAVLPALLLAAAIFIKHNLVAMPLVLAIWLAVYQRGRAQRFVGVGAALALIGVAAFQLVYGSSLLSHLASARTYSLSLLLANTENWLLWSGVPILALATLVAVRSDDRFVTLCALYAGMAAVIGIAFSGGAGVDVNAFFDADIALSLSIAVALTRFAALSPRWSSGTAVALLLPLAAGLYAVSDVDWRDPDFWAHPMAGEAALARADIAFLEDHKGPAACETLALCYWAGKPATIDVFNIGEAIAANAHSDAAIVRDLRNHAYGVIELDTLKPFALGPHVRNSLLAAYRIDHADDNGVFFAPR